MKHLILFLALMMAPAAMAAPEFDTHTCETQTMTFKDTTIEACAQAAHEANRAYCAALGDTSQLPWEQAPEWQRESCRVGVRGVLIDGNTPEQSHESWLRHKAADGWRYGETKDPEAKTHPCFVPYDQLPPEQRAKDGVFVAVVRSVATAIEPQPVKAAHGSVGYEAYAASTGGKTFDGRDMPRWSDLPERIQKAWNDASLAIRGAA